MGLRIFKPLRLVKLTRLLKTLPMVLVLIDAVEKLLRIPVFLSRLFRLLVAKAHRREDRGDEIGGNHVLVEQLGVYRQPIREQP